MVFALLHLADWAYCSHNHLHGGLHMATNVLLLHLAICSWHGSIVSLLTLVIHKYVIQPSHLHDVHQLLQKLLAVMQHDMLEPIL